MYKHIIVIVNEYIVIKIARDESKEIGIIQTTVKIQNRLPAGGALRISIYKQLLYHVFYQK